MSDTINSFRGENFYLSNFYQAPVTYKGHAFKNNEAAFQAQKCTNPDDIAAFEKLNPSEAKRRGRKVKLRSDWEDVKVGIMRGIVTAKFKQNPDLKAKLVMTGDAYLEEGNDWGDRIWGTVNGEGSNYLGKILMGVRNDLRNTIERDLVVLERDNGIYGGIYGGNGLYGGYVWNNDHYEQVFNVSSLSLFLSIKSYMDKGYNLICLDGSRQKAFMDGRLSLI